MDGSKFNVLMAEVEPHEIRDIPRFVDVWCRAGWMDEDEADQWRRGFLAWDAFHRISPGKDPS